MHESRLLFKSRLLQSVSEYSMRPLLSPGTLGLGNAFIDFTSKLLCAIIHRQLAKYIIVCLIWLENERAYIHERKTNELLEWASIIKKLPAETADRANMGGYRIHRNNEDKMKIILVIPVLVLLAAAGAAQTTPAPAPAKNPVSAALRDILPGRQRSTVAAVEAMPADKFNYKPSADQRTFGQLLVHMAETNDLLCSKAAAVPVPKVEEGKDTNSKDKLVAALKASFDFCSDALAGMDDSKLAETTEGFGGKQVTRAWISLTLAGTWADHYAEAAMYLRPNGVLPPTGKK
jgi:hypothetical protein